VLSQGIPILFTPSFEKTKGGFFAPNDKGKIKKHKDMDIKEFAQYIPEWA